MLHPYRRGEIDRTISSLCDFLLSAPFGERVPSQKTIRAALGKHDLSIKERAAVCRLLMLKCMHRKYIKCLTLQQLSEDECHSMALVPLHTLNFEIFRLGRFVLKHDRNNFPPLKTKLRELNSAINSMHCP